MHRRVERERGGKCRGGRRRKRWTIRPMGDDAGCQPVNLLPDSTKCYQPSLNKSLNPCKSIQLKCALTYSAYSLSARCRGWPGALLR